MTLLAGDYAPGTLTDATTGQETDCPGIIGIDAIVRCCDLYLWWQ